MKVGHEKLVHFRGMNLSVWRAISYGLRDRIVGEISVPVFNTAATIHHQVMNHIKRMVRDGKDF